MLEEAVAEARGGGEGETIEEAVAVINIGMPVLIPESCVSDLNLRMSSIAGSPSMGVTISTPWPPK